jgi:hypothetical protein
MLPIAEDTTPVRFEPLVVVTTATKAVVVVGENKVVAASPLDRPPSDVDTKAIPPVNIAALAVPVVDSAIDVDPGHCPGSEIVECVGAGKVNAIKVG